MVSTLISAILPTMSIFAQYFVRGPLARPGSIVTFAVLSSATLAITARA